MSVEGQGNYNADDDLESIEDGHIPGTSTKGIVSRYVFSQDNPTKSDYGTGTGPVTTITTDLDSISKPTDPLSTVDIDPSFNTPRSRTPMSSREINARNLELNVEDSSFNKVAWVIEHGETRCASCEVYYIPQSMEHARVAHCGTCPEDLAAQGKADPTQNTTQEEAAVSGNAPTTMMASIHALSDNAEEGDVVDGEEIKTGSRLASTDDYLSLFQKTASDSELYYRGYEDAKAGKELDVDLAEVSDDYFHGFQQYKFYKSTPQSSAPQNVYDIKPNSNLAPRAAKKTASGELEQMGQMILHELEEIEEKLQCQCGNSANNQFNGQPQCSPGEGCAANATPGACPQCGNSFHGHDVCSCRGGCGGGMSLNAEGEDLATVLRHDAGHDDWHRGMGQEPCTDEADCAAKAQEHKNREHLNPLAASRSFNSALPVDVVNRFFEI